MTDAITSSLTLTSTGSKHIGNKRSMESPPRSSNGSSSGRAAFTDAANREHLDLWRAAREGDVERCRFLVEVKGMDVNAINAAHNASALYYAALCGHSEVCEYLLAAGARLETEEFQGERVFYAALNDDLRKYLRRAAQLSIAYRDPYLEDLRRIYEARSSLYPDLSIAYDHDDDEEAAEAAEGDGVGVVRRRTTPCHRAMLRARSPFFDKGLRTRWAGKRSLRLRFPREARALECVLQWLYTGRLELPAGLLRSCVGLSKALQLPALRRALRDKVLFDEDDEEEKEEGMAIPESEGRRRGRRLGQHRRKVIVVDPDKEETAGCFRRLAQEVLSRFVEDADVVVFTEDGRSVALHRVLLCGRSEFFRTMFASSFREGQGGGTTAGPEEGGGEQQQTAAGDREGGRALPSVHLDISWAALRQVVHWLYADELLPPPAQPSSLSSSTTEEGDDEKRRPAMDVALAVEVLDAATRFLLPGLKTLCCQCLIEQSDAVDVFSLHDLATLYELPRLENHVSELFARDLSEAVQRPEFHELVAASAATIEHRQATDTIPFLDDLRFAIIRLYSDSDEAAVEGRFALLDEVLSRLNLGVAREV